MKITIITVTYNSEEFISCCIQSVLNQTYNNVEYIIIDGNSTDNTQKIIDSYRSEIDKYVSEPDNGIYDAINKGIELSTGDIIGIVNSDDFLSDKDVLKRVASAFEGDRSLEAVFADVQFVDRVDSSKPVRYYSSKRFRPWMFRYGFQPAHPTFYVKKELFARYGAYETNFKIAGDFELLIRFLLVKRIKYKYLTDAWVTMRTGGVSTSGVSSILIKSNEILQACKANEVYTNKLLVYSKYLFKWWGFVNF